MKVGNPVPVALVGGITVGDLIGLLKQEDPNAHVVKFNEKSDGADVSRVSGLSRVSIKDTQREREVSAVMLE